MWARSRVIACKLCVAYFRFSVVLKDFDKLVFALGQVVDYALAVRRASVGEIDWERVRSLVYGKESHIVGFFRRVRSWLIWKWGIGRNNVWD